MLSINMGDITEDSKQKLCSFALETLKLEQCRGLERTDVRKRDVGLGGKT